MYNYKRDKLENKHRTKDDHLDQCFSTFVRPRPGKFFFFFKDKGPVPTNLLVNNFPIFLSSHIKLT